MRQPMLLLNEINVENQISDALSYEYDPDFGDK